MYIYLLFAMIAGGNLGQKIKAIFFFFLFNSDVFKFLWLFTLISSTQNDGKYKRVYH